MVSLKIDLNTKQIYTQVEDGKVQSIIVGMDKKKKFRRQTYNARWEDNNTVYSGKTPKESILNLLKGIPYV